MFEIKNLDWFEILEKIKLFATSEAARLLVAETNPFSTPDGAQVRF